MLGAGPVSGGDGRGMGAECGRSGSSSSLQSLGGEMGHLTSPRWGLPPPPISAHRLPSPLLHPGLLSPQLLCGLPQTARLLWASDSALLSRGVCTVLPGPSAGSQEKRGQCLQNKAAFRGQRLGMGFGGLGCEGCAWVDPTWHPAQGLACKRCWDCFVIHGSAPSPLPRCPLRWNRFHREALASRPGTLSSCCLSQVQGDPTWVEGSLVSGTSAVV